ncbi:LacI family DNA-binding transcriptional regulator [Alkalibacterium indicireducens]|uniref:LacI family DNA-binding transcriptional regulator n=1 Tax=Alkalibacterium indicireducens TaxID=398758 RepID=UPI003D15BBA2
MVTIKQVAEYAGVSVATVSRTLNDSGYVGKESRKKWKKRSKYWGTILMRWRVHFIRKAPR